MEGRKEGEKEACLHIAAAAAVAAGTTSFLRAMETFLAKVSHGSKRI